MKFGKAHKQLSGRDRLWPKLALANSGATVVTTIRSVLQLNEVETGSCTHVVGRMETNTVVNDHNKLRTHTPAIFTNTNSLPFWLDFVLLNNDYTFSVEDAKQVTNEREKLTPNLGFCNSIWLDTKCLKNFWNVVWSHFFPNVEKKLDIDSFAFFQTWIRIIKSIFSWYARKETLNLISTWLRFKNDIFSWCWLRYPDLVVFYHFPVC